MILLLLVSAALILIVTVGGWSKLQGAQIVSIAYIIIYVVMAFYGSLEPRRVARSRGAGDPVRRDRRGGGAGLVRSDKAGFEDPAPTRRCSGSSRSSSCRCSCS